MAATPTPRKGLVLGAAAAVAVLIAVVLAGALGGGGGDGGARGTSTGKPSQGTPTTGGGRSALARDGERVGLALLDPADDLPAAVASARGGVKTYGGPEPKPAFADIVAVEVGSTEILLRWRLRSAGGVLDVDALSLSAAASWNDTTDGVVLVDPAGKEEARPFQYRSPEGHLAGCVCSTSPVNVDERGQEFSGIYPLFSTTPAHVDVHIPGFPPITGVPVTRR